ncbi:MAG: sensor histidine kinase [Clostridiales bacterium]|nr:sensor histidine kinase [Clostridiales bacterium]
MKKKTSSSIRSQIFIYFMFTTSIILIIMGLVLYSNFSNVLEEEITSSTNMIINKSGSQLDRYIDSIKGLSVSLADNVNTCTLFDDNHTHIDFKKDKRELEFLINTIINGNKDIESITLVGQDGLVISTDSNLSMEVSEDMMAMAWYQDAIGNKMPVLTSARMNEFSMDKDTWVISLSREIKSDCQENIGVLLIDMNYAVIEEILDDLHLGNEGYTYIINSDNELVYHKDFKYFTDQEKLEQLLLVDQSTNQYIFRYPFIHANWTLVGVASLDSLHSIQQDLIVALIIVGLFMFLIALGSSIVFSRRVVSPLKKLERAMEQVDQGNLNQTVIVKGSKEAESLATYYTNMMIKIKKLLTEIKEKEMVLRSSELQVLYSQINPHFLYNTLDTILWAAEFKDSEKVIDLTKALATFFRLSLHGGSEITTINEEIEHVKQYLFIQKQRYQDKLTYEIKTDDTLLAIKIPKLILQPIVENSIYHGIKELVGIGKITITVTKKNKDILFTITDNGVGFDVTKKHGDSSSLKLGGVGLSNIDKRLKLYYGNDYGVTVISEKNKETTVILTITPTYISS